MLTSTIKSTLLNTDPDVLRDYVLLISIYPDISDALVNMKDPITHVILCELERQYERWNKQGV